MPFKRVAHLDIRQVYATDANGVFQWREFVKQANENPSQDRSKFLPKEAYKYDTNNFLFLTARAISGGEKWGHNGNYDYFPWEEIKKALPTYPGCGFYIEHKEDSVEDAKGIILDAFADDEQEYVTCLCAIDKNAFPEFCQQLLDGTYNQVSMSCLANECECSECHNVAHSFDELCQHMNPNMPITYMKGKVNDKGEDIYEINRDLCFTGLSSVEVPADKDAFVFDIKASKKKENKLQAELLKYQNIKQAAKMKEFKTACEEQFKSLDTIALLNKLQNCATAITNQVVDQQSDVNILNTPLQGILRQLMELQIGLTVLDLNKLTEKEEDFVDNTVAVEGEQETPIGEVTTNIEEKVDDGHILTNDELEEVNLDKEINSMLKEANLLEKESDARKIARILSDAIRELLSNECDHADCNMSSFYKSLKLITEAQTMISNIADDFNSKRVEDLDKQEEADFDKEIESYDNWSYTPFSSTAKKNNKMIKVIKSGTWAIPETKREVLDLQEMLLNPIKAKDAKNLIYDLVGDDELFDKLDIEKEQNPEADVRPIIISRLKELLNPKDYNQSMSLEIHKMLMNLMNRFD